MNIRKVEEFNSKQDAIRRYNQLQKMKSLPSYCPLIDVYCQDDCICFEPAKMIESYTNIDPDMVQLVFIIRHPYCNSPLITGELKLLK